MARELILKNCKLYYSLNDSELVDVLIQDGVIIQIGKITNNHENGHFLDTDGRIVVPGFIDVHIQGAGGADILDGSLDALQTISKTLARFGTTSFLATTVVHSNSDNIHLELAAKHTGENLGGANLLGIHLEGPFVNLQRRGGMSRSSISDPSTKTLEDILNITAASLKIMTIAPELDGSLDVIHQLVNRGVVASFGHSNATYDETKIGFDAGISHVTHIFNAMPPFHHRTPGPLLAIFEANDISVQIIADGVHLHPGIIKMIYQIIGEGRSICITDGIQAIGLPEGRYLYNGREYESKDGVARYLDGTLIGTAIGLDQLAMRFKKFNNCSFEAAMNTVAKNPAKLLGIEDRKGSIGVGKDADLVVFDTDYSVWATIIDGRIIFQK
ncbi:N-acetylglucosamine-6-phosphate deacetylase [candidate division KSB1 bacterium]|nr:N-acetylglucosamine-6-phosphate deacetylase [candidate division KSB1 bacterium]